MNWGGVVVEGGGGERRGIIPRVADSNGGSYVVTRAVVSTLVLRDNNR